MGRYVNIQTLEEFTAEVKRQLTEESCIGNEKEFDEFFNSDKVQKAIKEKFYDGYERLKQGKITQRVFDEGTTSSIANCLYYMF